MATAPDFFSDLSQKPEANKFFSDIPQQAPVVKPKTSPTMQMAPVNFFADLEGQPSLQDQQAKPPGFLDRLGQAFAYQMQSGGPAGAPSLSPDQAKKVAAEAGTQIAIGEAFAPLKILATASKYAPGFLRSLVNISQAGTTGAAIPAVESLTEKGELPSKGELLKHGAIWAGIDAAIQLTHAGAEFGVIVNKLKAETGLPTREVLNRLWQGAKKHYGWKHPPTDPETGAAIIAPEQIEAMADLAVKEPETIIEATVKEKGPSPIPEPKAAQEPKVRDFENIDDVRAMLSDTDKKIKALEALGPRANANDERLLNTLRKTRPGLVEVLKELETRGKPSYLEPEPEKSVTTEAPKPVSGYVRKPEPKTVPEKIAHLSQKVKESEAHVENMREAIDQQKQLIEDLKKRESQLSPISYLHPTKEQRDTELRKAKERGEIKASIMGAKDNLEQKRDGLSSEKDYLAQLKAGLRDLKEKKEASRYEVPLGRGGALEKKVRIRPAEKELAEKQPSIMGKKQAIARSEILNLFRKAFTDPIRLGKFGQRASGIHKLWSRVTRLLKDNDIETAAHEIGHNLHTTLYGGDAKTHVEQRENINAALRPYLDELKPLALYEPFGMEGFAEFTRLYVTNPDTALKLAPKFYAKFDADLEAQYPELRNALLEARDYYEQYLQGTPESRIRAQTDYGDDSSKLDNLVDWVKSSLDMDKLKTNFLDDVFPAKRLVAEAFGISLSEVENLKDPRNLYRSLRVLKGAIGRADVFLTHETFDAKTLKRKGRGLRQILRKLKTPEEYKEFNDYLIARRVMEKGKQNIETGINYGDAIVTERNLAPKYKKLAVLLDHYNDALLTYARDGGVLSNEQYAAIKKANMMYVPFQRVIEKPAGVAAIGGRLQAGKPIKRMKGSTRDIIAPIESVIKNTYAIIVNAEKNLSGQALAELAKMRGIGRLVEYVPAPIELKAKISREEALKQMEALLKQSGWITEGGGGLGEEKLEDFGIKLAEIMPDFFLRFGPGTYPAGENIITVFHEGKPSYFEVSPEIYQMWTKGIAPYTADIITKILRIPARALRAGAILNPKFMMKNIVRDTWGGFLFTKYGKNIKDPPALFLDTLYAPLAQLGIAAKQAKLYVEWMKSGGGMSTMQSMDREAIIKKLKEVRDGLQPHQVIRWLRKVAEISEEANRLAEFGRALNVEGETRLGKEIAAFASRDLSIDFAKMGLQTKALNQIIPFWNATVQGGDKLIRTLASDQDRAEFIARAVGFILIPSLILAWMNQDDERVKEFYEEEKDFNFISFIGDTAIKIPVPFETGVLVHGLTQRMYNHFIKKDPHAFEGFIGSIASAMLPNFVPAFANPFVEAAANRNFFTGAPIIPRAKEGLVAKYQYKNNSSATARLLGRAMTYMMGQDTRSKAASPAVIDHFINSWGAGLGRLVVSLADAGLEAAGLSDKIPGPEKTITERLGLDAFVSRYPRASARNIEKFYDMYADATARRRSIKQAEKVELEEPEAIEEAYERVESLYDYPTLQRAYKAMQKNQRAINEIWQNPDIDEKTKRTMIDDLYLQQIQFAKEAVEDIEKYRLAG